MNVKAIIPLVAGLCIGGFALKIGIDKLQSAKGTPAATVQVWAATVDIPRGNSIGEEMLKPMAYPANLIPPGAFKEQDKEQLLGRVPRVDMPAELPILAASLMPPGHNAGIQVPPGYRAVAVKIDEGSGVDFHLEPGSHVDVVGYFTYLKNKQQQKVARTIIENVEVAAVGPRFSSVDNEKDGTANRPTRAVTLLVKPEKVKDLHLAEQQGKIKLCMRNEEDSGEIAQGGPINLDQLIDPTMAAEEDTQDNDGQGSGGFTTMLQSMFAKSSTPESIAEPAPPMLVSVAPPPDPAWKVMIYRGDKAETVRFKDRYSCERVEERPTSVAIPPSQALGTDFVVPPKTRLPRTNQSQPVFNPAQASCDQEEEEDQEPQEPTE